MYVCVLCCMWTAKDNSSDVLRAQYSFLFKIGSEPGLQFSNQISVVSSKSQASFSVLGLRTCYQAQLFFFFKWVMGIEHRSLRT